MNLHNNFLKSSSLSNALFNKLFKSVNLKNKKKRNDDKQIFIQEQKRYIKNLINKIEFLKQLKKNNYKNLNSKIKKKNNQNLIVAYIISISFRKANTTIHVLDTNGNVKLFYSAGSTNLSGKQKTKRRISVSKLITLLIKKATFLKHNPIALHLNNVNFYRNLIVNKLQQTLYIRVIKSFNQSPYNGCRRKKIRRKKHTKKFK